MPDDDPTVFAPLDGRVVAARVASPELAADDGEPLFPLGSGNFVLIKHRFEVGGTEHEVFGLYMHLADPVLALEGDHQLLSPGAAKLPWLREIALAPDRPADVDEAADLDWRNLYLKVVRPAGGKLGDDDLEAGTSWRWPAPRRPQTSGGPTTGPPAR